MQLHTSSKLFRVSYTAYTPSLTVLDVQYFYGHWKLIERHAAAYLSRLHMCPWQHCRRATSVENIWISKYFILTSIWIPPKSTLLGEISWWITDGCVHLVTKPVCIVTYQGARFSSFPTLAADRGLVVSWNSPTASLTAALEGSRLPHVKCCKGARYGWWKSLVRCCHIQS